MMPGDGAVTSIVQRVARQALLTFRGPPRAAEDAGKSFRENHAKLRGLMTEVRAADLRLAPHADRPPPRGAPPVSYMHICETERFSMGVFLLQGGASIPLHDHPGMHGVLKVLYGTLRISCFDRPEPPPQQQPPPLQPPRPARSVLRSAGEYTEHSAPCVLSPDRDNLHQIDAVGGPSAFMDILAPPYDPEHGRDCHYYRLLPGPEGRAADPQGDKEVWLVEISQPPDFWCGGEPYPGPEVHL